MKKKPDESDLSIGLCGFGHKNEAWIKYESGLGFIRLKLDISPALYLHTHTYIYIYLWFVYTYIYTHAHMKALLLTFLRAHIDNA